MSNLQRIVVEKICNLHSHIREGGEIMRSLIKYAIEGGADVIGPQPNTEKGLTTTKETLDYKELAESLVPKGENLCVVPFIMITEDTTENELLTARNAGIQHAKIYPKDRTTRSENGVRDYSKIVRLIKFCGEIGIFVHVHPEHPWMVIGNRDAEYQFLSIADMFLRLTKAVIIWEHATDARCIAGWKEMAKTGRFFITVTAHHLAANEDRSFGDVRLTCKPPAKTEQDRLAHIALVEEDLPWVLAAADDAPHDNNKKHVHTGRCACGAFTTPFLMLLYAHDLDHMIQSGEMGVEIFNRFISRNSRKAYGLAQTSTERIIVREPFLVPMSYIVGKWEVEPAFAGEELLYSFHQP